MASIFNAYVAYQFIKTLTTKWSDMEAYDLGIIDENGKQLKKTKDLDTQKEKNAYTVFHRVTFNLKRILEKFPFGRSRIASYAAALALLRENKEGLSDDELEMMEEYLCEYINHVEREQQTMMLNEEIANAVGDASNLAGLGANPPQHFGGMKVFSVKNDTYTKLFKGKKKYARWKKYMETDEAEPIRDYIRKNPKKKVILMDNKFGTMMILYRHNEI